MRKFNMLQEIISNKIKKFVLIHTVLKNLKANQ